MATIGKATTAYEVALHEAEERHARAVANAEACHARRVAEAQQLLRTAEVSLASAREAADAALAKAREAAEKCLDRTCGALANVPADTRITQHPTNGELVLRLPDGRAASAAVVGHTWAVSSAEGRRYLGSAAMVRPTLWARVIEDRW
jgi:hypothetical protein